MEFSPHHRKKSSSGRCCVSGCTSDKSVNLNLSFHTVPKVNTAKIVRKNLFGKRELVDKRSEWLKRLKVADETKELLVCSLHFSKDDYYLTDYHSKRRILRKEAVPMLVTLESKQVANKQREERKLQRQARKEKEEKVKDEKKQKNKKLVHTEIESQSNKSVAIENREEEPEYHDLDCELLNSKSIEYETSIVNDVNYELPQDIYIISNIISNFNIEEKSKSDEKSIQDKSIQVTSGDFIVSFCSFIKTDQDLITMCSIRNFKILDELTSLVDEAYPSTRKTVLNTREKIILTTAKLKLDISFNALAILFNQVSEVTIRNIFYDTVKKLASVLQSVVTRVSKEEIERNMPKCFTNFKATTSVLDCTEVKIQKPKCLKCRIKLYSHYKGDLTIKFMTEVTPAGIIVFVSESFGGRASDKCIFNCSGILQNLESTRDAIMVDKGFLIDEECLQKRIKLIRPPFLRNQQQLSEEDALLNRKIASARVHIERMNQRIKQFQLLNNKIPWYFINYIDDIFLICCGLANLGTPILSDDKF